MAGNYISALIATWNDVKYTLFQIFHKLSLFLFFADIYAMQATIFDMHGKKIFQIKPSNILALFYKIFEEFNDDLYF